MQAVGLGVEVVDLGAHPGGAPEAEDDCGGEHPAGGLDDQGCRRGRVGEHGDGQQLEAEDQTGGQQAEQDGGETGNVRLGTGHDEVPPLGRVGGGHAGWPAVTRDDRL